jgi:hypothetical protein
MLTGNRLFPWGYELNAPTDIRGLGDHIRDARRRIRRSRPLSFYLLVAMAIVLLGGGLLAPAVDDRPRLFFAYLAALFLFLFVVMAFAIRDGCRILRHYVRDSKDIYPTTLGDQAFTAQLAQRIAPKPEE